MLLLDEPFGALDALTRARLQTELQRIWQKERITMILVTHDVEEAVYLGDRVVIMQPRPGRIRRIVDVPLPHARNRSDPRFIRLRDDVLSDFLEPDGAPPTTARRWQRRRRAGAAVAGLAAHGLVGRPNDPPLIRLGTPRHDPPSAPDQARRLPDADRPPHRRLAPPGAQADAAVNFRHYVDLARRAEAAKFDAIFLADAVGVRNTDLPSLSRARSDHFEPLTLLSALAAVTEKIGLIATVSTTYNEPYHVARKFASLDQISGGRSGWNLVTSSGQGEAQNFKPGRTRGARAARAAEFHDVVLGLWDSWEDDAFLRDADSGQYFDPAKLHPLHHRGEHFKVRGPLNVARSPQGRPVVVQAGASPAGRDLAARSAEVIFVAHQTFDEAQSFYRDIKRRAGYGRDPDSIKVMPGIFPVVGHSQAEADEKFARLQDLIHPWSECSCCRT